MQEKASPKKLGLWATTSLVVGNMIGSGIFLMPATLALFGGISLVGWLVAAVGAYLMSVVFGKLSKELPGISGGPYTFTREGFGDFMGFLVAWGYWISIWCTNAAIAVSFVGSMSTFFPILEQNAVVAVITGLAAIWFLTWINTRGVVASGNMQLVTTVLKLLPLIVIGIGGLFYIKFSNFTPFNISGTSNLSAIIATTALTFFAFLGMECATIPAGDVENAEKIVPRATSIGTLLTSMVYILSTIAVMGIISPKDLQHSVNPFADAAIPIFGNFSKYWIAAGVAIANFGALNGWILIQGQIPAAISRDKLFPAILKKENSKGVPAVGIIVGSVLVSLLMMMNYTKGLVEQYKYLISLSTLTSVVPYLFSMAAYLIICMKKKSMDKKSWTSAILLSAITFLFSFGVIIGLGEATVFSGFLLLIAGVPFYVWVIYNKLKNK